MSKPLFDYFDFFMFILQSREIGGGAMRRTNPDSLKSCLFFRIFRLNFASDLFDNNYNSYASTHNRKCVNKCIISQILVRFSELGAKNLNKICQKVVQKTLKWPLQYVNFQKFSGEAYPRTPLEPLLFLILILPKKICVKKCLNLMPSYLKKFLNTPLK